MPSVGLVAGKSALVTGGGSGIGRATALLLAREGARVFVCDLNEAGARETARMIEAAGGEARSARTDVSREAEVAAVVRAAQESFGRLACAVNSAGVPGATGPLHEIDAEGWLQTLAVNLTGVFLCMKHELLAMGAAGGGSIVNIASGAGIIGVPGMGPYCATKHGVLGLTKTAAIENATRGVRVNAVCPGTTDTPMVRASLARGPELEKMIRASLPGGRLGLPEEIAEAAVWLCSPAASFVCGAALPVDGGYTAR